MPDISLMPLAGMNTEAEDKELHRSGDSPRHYVRDAVNVKVNSAGEAELRPGTRRVTSEPLKNLWQSPLHRDTFATLADQWVKVDPHSWTHEPLATVGEGEVYHDVLNNQVVVAAPAGIFTYNGAQARRLTLDTPAAPWVVPGSGALKAGKYGVAVAWLRDGQESALSEMTQVDVADNGSLAVTLPMCLDATVTGARLYLTKRDGGELRREKDYPLTAGTVSITVAPELGAAAPFRYLSQMPTGKYLKYWRGRLLTAKANMLRFSEALAYHLHDERHGFVLMPQRITFVQPVSGGIWVGQVDHVAFLQGSSPDQLAVMRKTSRAPVPGTAILVDSDTVGSELGAGGDGAALWLADNGYVVGTASGQVVELHRGVLGGITGQQGTSVVLDRRLMTTVT